MNLLKRYQAAQHRPKGNPLKTKLFTIITLLSLAAPVQAQVGYHSDDRVAGIPQKPNQGTTAIALGAVNVALAGVVLKLLENREYCRIETLCFLANNGTATALTATGLAVLLLTCTRCCTG